MIKKHHSPVVRVEILGVGISVLNLDTTIQIIKDASVDATHAGYITITGVHGVMESQDDNELKAIHNNSFLTTPDGMPMVWIGKHEGHREMDRVYGPELMDEIFKQTQPEDNESGLRHFFYGGADGVAPLLKEKLLEKYPNSEIVGTYTPPFRPLNKTEEQDLLAQLHETKPHLLWIGLSTPKQERFMHAFLVKYSELNQSWGNGISLLGVGAAFDFLSGRVRQAPRWVQRSGFEWLYRVFQEPKRLLKRYIVSNTRFVGALLKRKITN
ncbi:MAG: WecB/TagA/CpsF family glycosyltransferase [Akkermansiaceae bacterium]